MLAPPLSPAEQYDTVDFGALVKTLKRRGKTIIAFMALAAIAALLHVLLSAPQFVAQGVLYLGDTQESNNSPDLSGPISLSAYAIQSDVETQIGLLTTSALAERAILETGLNTRLWRAGSPKLNYWRWRIFDHADPKVFEPKPGMIRVYNATLSPGHYAIVIGSNDTFRLYPKGEAFGKTAPLYSGPINQPASIGAYSLTVEYVTPNQTDMSPAVFPKVSAGTIFNLDVVPADVLADAIAGGGLSVRAGGSPMQPTKLTTLQLRWPDPYQAKEFINRLMLDYIAMRLQWKTEAASVTENFVAGQIANVSKKLTQADAELSAFQANTNIVDPRQNSQVTIEQMSSYQTQREAMLLKKQALQQLYSSLRTRSREIDPYLISETEDPVLSGLTSSLSAAMVKLRKLETDYMPASQDVDVQQAEVDELRRSISDLISNDLTQASQNLENLDRLISAYQTKVQLLPAEALRVSALERTSDQLGQFYKLLTDKAEQAQISKASTIIDTRVIAGSKLPYSAASPNPKIAVLAGAIGGLFLGLIVVFLQQTLSSRYETEEQVRRMIKLPVYGTVPLQKAIATGSSFFGPQTPNSFSEAFRLINRTIRRYLEAHLGTVILVISPNEGDGKTTISVNLAKTLADDGSRVVMLDCDMYLSKLNKTKGFSLAPIKADQGKTAREPEPQRWPGEEFWIIPAGEFSTIGGHLDERSFAVVLEKLRREFDYIVLDSPPLPVASDGLALGRFADLILSVVSLRNTERRSFEVHNELIAGLGRQHGLIINGVEGSSYTEADGYFLGMVKKRKRFSGWFGIKLA